MKRQYYQLFLNLLEAQGYAVVPMENDVLKVVKSSAAKVEPLPLVGEGSDNYAGDEMVTKVVPVRNVSVRELAPILRQMIDSAGSGNVVNYDPSNVIMLTGRASVVERLTEVIQRVDHAGNRTEEVIPLDNASASEIARVLESLTKNSGENQPATLKSQIVADERTNSVIVSGDPATRDKNAPPDPSAGLRNGTQRQQPGFLSQIQQSRRSGRCAEAGQRHAHGG